MKQISLVLPIYNEQLELQEVLAKYITELKSLSIEYEIIAVNDGSDDATADILTKAAKLNRNLRIVNFEGRFGKQAAITAGMAEAVGACVILADIDILNPIGIIERVYKEFQAGNQIVYAYRERAGFTRFKYRWSDHFVRFATNIFGVDGNYTGRVDIALFSRNVTDVLAALPGKNKLLRTMDNWIGYTIKKITYASSYNKTEEHDKRVQMKKMRGDISSRSKVREHTSSLIGSAVCAVSSLIVLVTAIVFLVAESSPRQFDLPFVVHFLIWCLFFILALTSLMYYARAVLIKRVGIVHDDLTAEIYKIKNIVN